MTAGCSYVVILHVTTSGDNLDDFGVDERQIIILCYVIYDVISNKVVDMKSNYVKPRISGVEEKILLTKECVEQTNVTEEKISTGQSLEFIIEQMSRVLAGRGLNPENYGKAWAFCCDGQAHMRLVLHPEAVSKGIQLPIFFNRFYDLRKEFRKFYHVASEKITGIAEMLNHVGIDQPFPYPHGTKQVYQMAEIVRRLLSGGHFFGEPEMVKISFESGVCFKNEYVDDESVIRMRGLPWQCSDLDIARFFRGLNIAKGGIALCLSQLGRRNGEALVRFECKEHRDLALRRHKHHMGQRYIEVYRASGRDFVGVAGGNSSEGQEFLSRNGQSIIRMRGLPYTASARQIVEFFERGDNPLHLLDGESGVLFVRQGDGRATGDAFVMFLTEAEGDLALTKHREIIGTRYIELFKSTTAEVQQVLNRSMEVKSLPDPEQQINALLAQIPPGTIPILPAATLPSTNILSSSHKNCIRLKSLPSDATVTDILTFLGEHSKNIIFQGVHMVYNSEGNPAGEAFIQMDSQLAAEAAMLTRNKKYMLLNAKKHYIDVEQCSNDELNAMIGGPGSHSGPIQQALPSINPSVLPTLVLPTSSISNCAVPISKPEFSGAPTETTSAYIPNLTNQSSFIPMQPGTANMPVSQGLPFAPIPSVSQALAETQTGATAQQTSRFPEPMATNFTPIMSSQYVQSLQPIPAATASSFLNQPATQLSTPVSASNIGLPLPAGMLNPTQPFVQPASSLQALQIQQQVQQTIMLPQQNLAQPLMYWYPNPSISPTSLPPAYGGPQFVQPNQFQQSLCSVIMRGLPANISANDIHSFFQEHMGPAPEAIQLQQTPDGRLTGEAVVTFSSRCDAERAIVEQNQKLLSNKPVELFMA